MILIAEKWEKELDCDQLKYSKGLVTNCIPKSYAYKLQADCKEGENNYFWRKKVVANLH